MTNLPILSKRIEEMQFSPIRKFVPLLEEAKRKGKEVFELHIGQPDFKTPGEILREIRNIKEEILPYTNSCGIEEIRKAWQKYYKDVGLSFDYSQVVVTSGGSEAILFAMAIACSPGEEIIVFEPFYTNYNGYASLAGIKLKPIRTLVKDGFHLPEEGKIVKRISKKTRAILICNPNNPTGAVYRKEELEMIGRIAKRNNLLILSDEAYREFVYDGKKHYSMASFPQLEERVILLDSVSKRFNACGVRIGCLASKNKKIIEGATKLAQARLSLPLVEQLAIIPLLKNSLKYVSKIVFEYKKRRDVVFRGLAKIPGVFCLKPEGAFYITVKLPISDSDDFARWLLEDFSYKGKTVMVAPASGFYASRGLGRNEVRVAFVLEEEKLKEAMEVFRIALGKYLSQKRKKD